MLVLFSVGSQASFCHGGNSFVEKYDHFLDVMEGKKYFNTFSNQKAQGSGRVSFDMLIPRIHTLKYDYSYNIRGAFIFVFDFYGKNVYISQYNEGAPIQKELVSGKFRNNSCSIDFDASENQKVTVDFNDDLNITFFYKGKDKINFRETTKFVISNSK